MTCPSLLRRAAPAGVRAGRPHIGDVPHRVTGLADTLRHRLGQDDARAQFARFVTVGAITSTVYALLFTALQGIGDQPANLVGVLTSTVLANELHRRLTFHAGQRVSWFTAQWEGGGLAGVGLAATSLTLAGVHELVGDVGTLAQLGLVAAVTGLIGLVRFVALRSWVFSPAVRRD